LIEAKVGIAVDWIRRQHQDICVRYKILADGPKFLASWFQSADLDAKSLPLETMGVAVQLPNTWLGVGYEQRHMWESKKSTFMDGPKALHTKARQSISTELLPITPIFR
jgi:hypothetical protein